MAENDTMAQALAERERRRVARGGDAGFLETLSRARRGEDISEASGLGQFASGFWKSVAGTYYGIKDLTVGLGEGDQEFMNNLRRSIDTAGWAGLTGQIGGELAQFIIPAGAAVRGGRALGAGLRAAGLARSGAAARVAGSGAARLLQAQNILPAAAVGAGYGALKLPENEYDSRSQNALMGAVGGAGGVLAGRALAGAGRAAIRGVAQTQAARELGEQGVQLTTGQAAEGALPRAASALARYGTGEGALAQNMRDAVEQFNGLLYRHVARTVGGRVDDAAPLSDITEAGMRDLRKMVQDGYERAWGSARLNRTAVDELNSIYQANRQVLQENGIDASVAKTLKKFDGLVKDFNSSSAAAADRELLKVFEAGFASNGSPVVRDTARQMRDVLRTRAADGGAALRQMDEAYPIYRTLVAGQDNMKAGMSSKSALQGTMSARDLLAASRREGSKGDKIVFGEAPLQEWAERGGLTVDRFDESTPLYNAKRAVARRLNPAAARNVMKSIDDVMLGRTGPQRAGQRAADRAGEIASEVGTANPRLTRALERLRRATSAGRLGIAYENEDD